MYFSYRSLNKVSRTFEYPIPRCDDYVEVFGDYIGYIYLIFLNNNTFYCYITGVKADQEIF